MQALTDPCLPNSWNVYSAYAGLFAMVACLGMQLIEFLAHQRFRSIRLQHKPLTAHFNADEFIAKKSINNGTDKSTSVEYVNGDIEKPKYEDTKSIEQINEQTEELEKGEQAIETNRKLKKKKSVNGEINNPEDIQQTNNKVEEPEQMQQSSDRTEEPEKKEKQQKKSLKSEDMEEVHNETQVPEKKGDNHFVSINMISIEPPSADLCEAAGHHHGAAFQDDNQRNKISTYLLELGIALHSVLIGLALGTTTDSFVALFIALCFHQFFEGIALGAQIANAKTISILSAVGMVIFFALTTPVGIAAGIGVHSGTYNPKSVSSLLVTGILDSLSAGVLIYVALVNLITAEMGTNAHAFYGLSTRLKLLYYTALYLGAAAMAVIGRWA